ncbi:hypothetical protein H5410_014731 [Solanum commersonii]|uniref:Uncharacterized protein n=1 Tax=Solanum commersonii TaxID=4109 RepID=A0A9J5ZS27_SOLCO|nr:hypothetical protein H5410_014731 [Solanum commersonii]
MPSHTSKDPHYRIKSSKWATHQTWHVGIKQEASANGRQQESSPTCISQGVCASGKQRWPTACNISQGLHESDVA